MIWTNGVALVSFAILLAPANAVKFDCGIERDVDKCRATTLNAEIQCLMKENPLSIVMGCITTNTKTQELPICRPPDDGIDNDVEQYYVQDTKKKGDWCVTPRSIIIQGPLKTEGGKKLGILGAIQACPQQDPDFHQCLCELNVREDTMISLSQWFKQVKGQDLSCSSSFTKRTSFLDETADTVPHLHAAQEQVHGGHRVEARASRDSFTIDRYGRPVYEDNTIGYRLPYFDQYIMQGTAARRCYIHPDKQLVAACRTWKLATTVTSQLSRLPIKANLTMYTPSATVTPSLTAAPDTTNIPQEQLVSVAGASSTAGSPTPTAGTGNGSMGSMVSSMSMGMTLWLALMTVVGTFLIL